MSRITETLERLGLTQYGARAYEALVGLGPSEATPLAEAASIPRTKAYAVLDELVQKGWATADDGRPRIYRPADPHVVIERRRSEIVAEIDHVHATLGSLYKERGVRFAGALWILEGERALVDRTVEMLSRAKRDIFFGYAFRLPHDAQVFAALKAAAERDVRVRLMVPEPGVLHTDDTTGLNAEIRMALVPLRILFVDQNQSMVAFQRQQADGTFVPRGLWNPNPEIIEQVFGVSEGLWEKGIPMGAGHHAPNLS